MDKSNLVRPEQFTNPDMFKESLIELIEAGLFIQEVLKEFPQIIESRKLMSAKQVICFLQYVINKFGEYRFCEDFAKGLNQFYTMRHTPVNENESAVYIIELTKKMLENETFKSLSNKSIPELRNEKAY